MAGTVEALMLACSGHTGLLPLTWIKFFRTGLRSEGFTIQFFFTSVFSQVSDQSCDISSCLFPFFSFLSIRKVLPCPLNVACQILPWVPRIPDRVGNMLAHWKYSFIQYECHTGPTWSFSTLCPHVPQSVPLHWTEYTCRLLSWKDLYIDTGLRLTICIFINAYLFNMTICLYKLIHQVAYNLSEGSGVSNLYQSVLSSLTLNAFDTWQEICTKSIIP